MMKMILILLAVAQLFLQADGACEVPVAKFWASANKAQATFYKVSGQLKANKTQASASKAAFGAWKKDPVMKTAKCQTAGVSEASSSFSATSANASAADLGSSLLVQIGQNNWCLTTKNKGIDYGVPEFISVMDTCFALMQRFANATGIAAATQTSVETVQTNIMSYISVQYTSASISYSFKTTKFPVMGGKGTILFYKLNFNNKKGNPNNLDSARYKTKSGEVKAAIKQVKIDWKGTTVLAMSTGDAWGLGVWLAQLDITSVAVGIKYYQVYYFSETQNYMLNCFDQLMNLSATAISSGTASSYTLLFNLRVDVLLVCFNYGFLVTTVPASTSGAQGGTTGGAASTAGSTGLVTLPASTGLSGGSSTGSACCVCRPPTVFSSPCYVDTVGKKAGASTATNVYTFASTLLSTGTSSSASGWAGSTLIMPSTVCLTYPAHTSASGASTGCAWTCPILFC